MIPTFKFNPRAKRLSARVEYVKGVPNSYKLILWERGSNNEVIRMRGNFRNDDDDEYTLPGNNDGRELEVSALIHKIPDDNPPRLKVTVFEDGTPIGSVEQPDKWDSNKTWVNIWIRLEAK